MERHTHERIWLRDARRIVELQLRSSALIKPKPVSLAPFRCFPYSPMSQIRPKRRLEWFDRGRSIQISCLLPLVGNTHETILPASRFLCLASFPSVEREQFQIPSGSHKGLKKMGRYQTEAAYLKSVLLWLQGNWTEPDPPRLYSLRAVPQVSPNCSTRRAHAALNRRDGIVDLPAFLPPRNSSE